MYSNLCTAGAFFLAKRTLNAYAEEERNYFSKVPAVAYTDMYVDDCLSGACFLQNVEDL